MEPPCLRTFSVRPNTTPIGQDRASQWRDVLFDPSLFEELDLVTLSFLEGIFS